MPTDGDGPDRPVMMAQSQVEDDGDGAFALAQAQAQTPALPPRRPIVSSRESDRLPEPPPSVPPASSWGLAPVAWRWGGSLGFEALYGFSGNANFSQLQPIGSLNGSGASYIWQPWFAQVSGNIGTTVTLNQNSSETANTSLTSNSLYGGARANFLPYSRFPLEAYFDVSDSRTSGEVLTTSYRNTQMGLRQGYRTVSGDGSYTGWYQRSVTDSGSVSGSFDQLQFTGRQGAFLFEDLHTFYGNLLLTRSQQPVGPDLLTYGASLNHAFQPADNLQIYDDLNYTQSDFGDFSGRSYLLASNVNWQSLDRPLTASGSARFFGQQASSPFASNDQKLFTLGGTATYLYSPNWTFSGGAGITWDPAAPMATSQILGANYQSNAIPFGMLTYNFGGGLTLINATGPAATTSVALAASQGVGGSRPDVLGGVLGYSLSQSYTFGTATNDAFFQDIVQTVGTTSWNRSLGTEVVSLNLIGTDTRYINGDGNSTDNINLTGTYSRFLTTTSSLFGNFSLQWNMGGTAGVLAASSSGSTMLFNGQVGYQNSALFAVPRLVFQSNFTASAVDLLGSGTSSALPGGGFTFSWNNQLYYNIGRLRLEAQVQLARFLGVNSAAALIRINRDFGN